MDASLALQVAEIVNGCEAHPREYKAKFAHSVAKLLAGIPTMEDNACAFEALVKLFPEAYAGKADYARVRDAVLAHGTPDVQLQFSKRVVEVLDHWPPEKAVDAFVTAIDAGWFPTVTGGGTIFNVPAGALLGAFADQSSAPAAAVSTMAAVLAWVSESEARESTLPSDDDPLSPGNPITAGLAAILHASTRAHIAAPSGRLSDIRTRIRQTFPGYVPHGAACVLGCRCVLHPFLVP